MNDWGRRNMPFLFIIDFEMRNPLLFSLDQINKKELLYDINGISNCPSCHLQFNDKLIFEKFPEPYESYSYKFKHIQKHISAGNTYLANLTCPTPVKVNLSLLEIFLKAKAKYKIWFQDQWLCFSPETFVTVRENIIRTFPMKGTIDASVDNALYVILNDLKETAEHYTIVDLMRNDLNMVAENVNVVKFRYADHIKTHEKELIQVSSVIEGELRNDFHSHLGEIIFKLLPAGSVSGAPKRKTMSIIRSAEKYKRGYYTGICGIFDGKDLDSCVLIRFIENDGDKMIYKSGGGITSWSDCQKEYREMIDKIYVPVD